MATAEKQPEVTEADVEAYMQENPHVARQFIDDETLDEHLDSHPELIDDAVDERIAEITLIDPPMSDKNDDAPITGLMDLYGATKTLVDVHDRQWRCRAWHGSRVATGTARTRSLAAASCLVEFLKLTA